MIIPLWIFLLAWLVAVGFYALMAGLSCVQMLRYGLASAGTYGSVLLFLGCAGLTLLVAGGYLATVDWSTSLSVLGGAPLEAPVDISL